VCQDPEATNQIILSNFVLLLLYQENKYTKLGLTGKKD